MQKQGKQKKLRKSQSQNRPGSQKKMMPEPDSTPRDYKLGRLYNKIALITGADSGIGRAVAVLFASEGAKISIAYLNEHKDARETKRLVDAHTECLLISGDLKNENHCRSVVKKTIAKFGTIDILVNNAAIHFERQQLSDITSAQFQKTFESNFYSCFWVTREAVPFMKRGSSIINTSSVTAYRGSDSLMDYASTKGAIVSFTRSLSSNLVAKGIRVNGVAPGPVWTPLIASSFSPKKIAKFGSDAPLGRAAQPWEIATSYLFLACEDATYFTGQFLHPNGGEIVNT